MEQERTIVTHGVGINPFARGPNYWANVYKAATDKEWDKLSKATQDAVDCAWDGTKYFQEEYGLAIAPPAIIRASLSAKC